MPPAITTRISSIALITATPPATFFIVGDQSEPGPPRYLDYFWKPPTWMTSPAVAVLGISATIVVATSIVLIGIERRRHRVSRSALIIDALSVAAGMLVAWSYRIMTAGVIGANIGAGLVIIFGTPLLLVLIVSAVVIAIRSRKPSKVS